MKYWMPCAFTCWSFVPAVREALVKAGAIVKPLRDWLPK